MDCIIGHLVYQCQMVCNGFGLELMMSTINYWANKALHQTAIPLALHSGK
ncbi:hypothetical protein [uncultured Candidatus Kuenenia sp.]|nr:hypothetical protein [uncultured Candidatus Kuenenia sp.]MBE7547879.1 hypothetical protein [Planctomycetia bacterium]